VQRARAAVRGARAQAVCAPNGSCVFVTRRVGIPLRTGQNATTPRRPEGVNGCTVFSPGFPHCGFS
jgi:hypothetical protein